ncbi:cbb3-type cytochrome oxidase assembly protein CcoS [Sinorhizobium sp. 7-81]|uniref:cbb3-type cytochrome oxidase assembly protein CcoS n=1 Tax=Sinorhizobium sp. 8-89 TaxID=3049089 RepID=UPI0024C34366|nr:cbb3-type cytochrome oxidase assembly protein CcoS [Sinorhizobium sp. 8-89]MDK1491265.1 cbb3-type cytochrome oxidase assembly protein CcoS [Sinorhizobium sp. 8-89]
MSYLAVLIPVALAMGVVGLGAFFWSLKSGQYEDLDGAAERVLLADEDEVTAPTGSLRKELAECGGVSDERRQDPKKLPSEAKCNRT